MGEEARGAQERHPGTLALVTAPRVLYVGLDPALVDFSAFPAMDASKLSAGIAGEIEKLRASGYETRWFPVDRGQTAAAALGQELERHRYEAVVIGAGLRTLPEHFVLFEALVNVVHTKAPAARLCFNTKPTDTLEAIRRWLER